MESRTIPVRSKNGKKTKTTVSPEDFECLRTYTWHLNPSGYVQRTVWVSGAGKVAKVYMHRQIAGCPRTLEVDHKDGDKLNNCRENLRLCLRAQNNAASRRGGGKYSRYRGVSYDKKRVAVKKWIAQISIDGRMKRIGLFLTEEEAAKAYDRVAMKTHGDFASLNFPPGGPD